MLLNVHSNSCTLCRLVALHERTSGRRANELGRPCRLKLGGRCHFDKLAIVMGLDLSAEFIAAESASTKALQRERMLL